MPDDGSRLSAGPGLDGSACQPTADGIKTVWVEVARLVAACTALKDEPGQNYRLLLDITAVDERERKAKPHGRGFYAGGASAAA